ncbi:chloride channel protein [Planktothrix mougeotii]|uniref:Chloride channel protein n=1 Tax=Planktothrix mougeotii LEGE 06226 TaxID=1828728 RepID=A0ABR9UHM2_9CYAN|nr:chloride channel protein [Planktothrix mougeotii]MBE9145945.1 chloride channel protein [Planktothrix mougeotii LEGE 06226]
MTTTLPNNEGVLPQQTELASASVSDRLTSLLNRLQPPPQFLILMFALLIGGGTGLVMVLFHKLVELFQRLTLEDFMGLMVPFGLWTIALIPPLGGLIVGLIRCRYQEFFGEGISSLINTQRIQIISPLRPFIKLLAAAISLGSGASLGPEGPSVEVGANLGAILGQIFQVSKERYRLLLGAGAAAGLAAGFNAPIAGVFFALEVILGTSFAASGVGLVLLASVVSSVVARIVLGDHPAFSPPIYEVRSNWELLLYLGLGCLASFVSLAYTQAIKFSQRCFRGEIPAFLFLTKIPRTVHPMLGGLFVGMIAIQFPHILGPGYGTIQALLEEGQFSLDLLMILLILKIIATSVSLGSGLVGGIFAPAMFIGATLGATYGQALAGLLHPFLPDIAPPAAYAMVGMAAVLAASVRAPLTAILLLFEMTQNYLIILPLMAAVGVSVLIVDVVQSNQSDSGLNLQQMGVYLERPNELEVLQTIRISEVMGQSYLTLPCSMPILEAGAVMVRLNCHTALILDETSQLAGLVTVTDIRRSIFQATNQEESLALGQQNLKAVCTTEILCAYEDEPVKAALERMAARDLPQLPVVTREQPRQVVGIIEKEQIALACNIAVTKDALQPYLPNV